MTDTTTTQPGIVEAEVVPMIKPSPNGRIDLDVQERVQKIIAEMNTTIKQRHEVIEAIWVARIAQEHLLMLGPGGTGKSFVARTVANHIDDSQYFETALDETTDPSQVFGPPDIKAMVEDGKTRRVVTGMLPEATDAFIDEFFNANGPLLHSIMPVLNERVFHNNGIPSQVPLRQVLAGTNKLNADADQAALWDRIHMRVIVDYINSRTDQADMVGEAIARMALVGRGTTTSIATDPTKVTIAELDAAHKQSLDLEVNDVVVNTFLDLRDELQGLGIIISDRRVVEGMAAVMANAWLRGHEEVKVADLDILKNMWWTLQDQIQTVRTTILAATNPGEKVAMELMDELDKLKKEMKGAGALGDPDRERRVGISVIRNADKLLNDAKAALATSVAAGSPTARLDDLIARTKQFKYEVGRDTFGLDPQTMQLNQDD